MSVAFVLIALFILVPAAVAMALRNLIHSALLLIASWAGIGMFYLWAGAEFVAFAQILVYVGAVSMIVLFAVLLTRPAGEERISPDSLRRTVAGLIAGGAVLGVLFGAILSTPLPITSGPAPVITVRELGHQLMGTHAAALLVIGVLLTVSLIGAVVLAAADRPEGETRPAARTVTRSTTGEDAS